MGNSPFFSIIMPVYNVEGLVRDCVKSIGLQTFNDYEVIAVEDCSTDSSRRVLNELADEYPIKVIELEQNKGLGNARNTGLARARGEYVLFVDSDDEIEPDLLKTIKSLSQSSDVVIFNFYREWITGTRRQNMATPLLEELSKRPIHKDDFENKSAVFSNLNVAWNKAYRRKFLLEHALGFDDGYYEDIAFNYKVIVLSEKISVTPFLGYKYRQRDGSILNCKSDRHKDLTVQYQKLYSFLERNNLSNYRLKTNSIFIGHLFNLLIKQNYRLTKFAEKSILNDFRKLNKQYKIDRDFKPPNFSDRIKLFFLKHTSSLFNGFVCRVLLMSKFFPRNNILKIKTYFSMRLKYALYYAIFSKLPVKDNIAVFEAYWGRSYSCNPRAISEYLEENTGCRTIWFGKKKVMDAGKSQYVNINTFQYFYYMGVAKYFVSNANFPNFVRKRKGTIYLQTKHGTPLKLMGCDELRKKKRTKPWFAKLSMRSNRWDYVVSSNPYSTEAWRKSFPYGYKVLEYGYPRNDYIVNNRDNKELIEKIRLDLGLPEEEKREIMLFMPTFREYHKKPNYYLDLVQFAEALYEKYIILIRAHYFNTGKNNLSLFGNIVDVTKYERVEHLYLVADLLLSDYSSAMFDFANLKKPILLYLPDFDEYQKKRGMYFDIRENPPGLFASDYDELLEVLSNGKHRSNLSLFRLNKFNEKFCPFDDGRAAENVCGKVFKI